MSIANRHSRLRRMLQTTNLCRWTSEEECKPNILVNIPDQDLLSQVSPTLCVLQKTIEECEALDQACRWNGGDKGTCRAKTLDHLEDCLDREYFMFTKGLRCREDYPDFDDCVAEEACVWDAELGVCAQNPSIVDEILDNEDSVVFEDLQTLLRCSGSTRRSACIGKCVYIEEEGRCSFPPFFDESRFFDADKASDICQFFLDVKECTASEDCDDPKCQRSGEDCFASDETLIDHLYDQDSTLQDQLKAAARECPGITTEDECTAFAG
ncbi:unnamed protein product [Ostreobium quekettii]|uniref:Uncharacterized protein n=1 Tax=Ostreobium quekettii TaxID=121088 RepID=A0A8S1JAB3_9CHLO|nr:unnamed protein product [Ostreobium quekettii]|eukprot:evm.model.scf_590.8 EVM.evm.TU.scf_590.8   scf_590:63795-66881(-)